MTMLKPMKIARAPRWYCPDLGQTVNMGGTQATCAAAHGCSRLPAHCPLFLHFFIKTTAWHLGLGS
jgi:hypothetical protein